MKLAEKAYMAGIIDGEGCVYVNRRKPTGRRVTPGYSVKVTVTTTDKCLVDWMIEKAGLRSVFHSKNLPGNRRQKWSCTWNSHHADKLLRQLRKFLVIKTKQADIGIKLCKHLRGSKNRAGGIGKSVLSKDVEFREKLKQEIAVLNKRGRLYGKMS